MTESKKYITSKNGHLQLSPDMVAVVQSELSRITGGGLSNLTVKNSLTISKSGKSGTLSLDSNGKLTYNVNSKTQNVLMADDLYFNPSKGYIDGDVCLYNGVFYRCSSRTSTPTSTTSPATDTVWTRITDPVTTRVATTTSQLHNALTAQASCVIVKTEGTFSGNLTAELKAPVVIIQSDEATSMEMLRIAFTKSSTLGQVRPKVYWHCKNMSVQNQLTVQAADCTVWIEHMVAPNGVKLNAEGENDYIYYQRIDGTVSHAAGFKAPVYSNWCSVVKPDKPLPSTELESPDKNVRLGAWNPSDTTDSYVKLSSLFQMLGSDLLRFVKIDVVADTYSEIALTNPEVGTIAYVDGSLYRRGDNGWEGPYNFKGPQGPQGETGPLPVLTIGTVSTADDTHDPGVTVSSTSNGAKLNFVLPVGPEGPRGPMGTGLTFAGEWDETKDYVTGNYVTITPEGEVADALWIAIDDIEAGGASPDEDTSGKWIALQAPAGPQGLKGDPGSPEFIVSSELEDTANDVNVGVSIKEPEAGDSEDTVRLHFVLPLTNFIISHAVANGDDLLVGAYKLPAVSGDAPEDVRLRLVLPQGVMGPPPVVEIGEVESGDTASASISAGQSEGVYKLNLTLPQGETGPEGPEPDLGVASVSNVPYGTDPSVSLDKDVVTGKWLFSFSIPQGAPGDTGQTGHTPDISLSAVSISHDQEPFVSEDQEFEPDVQGDKSFILNIPKGAPAIIAGVTAREVEDNEVPSATLIQVSGTENTYMLSLLLPHGIKGDTGDTGPMKSIEIGTVTVDDSGRSPEVTVADSDEGAAVLNFKLPRGRDGRALSRAAARHAMFIYGM